MGLYNRPFEPERNLASRSRLIKYVRFPDDRQNPVGTPPAIPLKIAVVQNDVHFTDEFWIALNTHRALTLYDASEENILSQLEQRVGTWDVIIYPIAIHWQRALDFSRKVRRIRERDSMKFRPSVFVVSFIDHLPITKEWFGRTCGTHYTTFVNSENFLLRLREVQEQSLSARRASQRLHLRLVHSGNPSGCGCIVGERLVAIYGSFYSGDERELVESNSVLNFLNLLAMNHWRFRSKAVILQLMKNSPFYIDNAAKVISPASVKTYVVRSEAALTVLWKHSQGQEAAPPLIARQGRGNKEVAYRLLCSYEIDHI